MSLIVADRVQETTNTTGTGAYTLGGVVPSFRTFASVASDADTVYYSITDNVNYEVGLGTYASSGGTIARTTVFASSNSNNAVNWGSGTKNIFLTYPADKAVIEDASNNVSIGNNLVVGGTVDGVDIAARDAVLTSTTTTANAALPKAGGAMTGAITTNSTFDGRDVATDGSKLDGIEAGADQTDTTNVTAAGALMDSEVTNLAQVKAFDSSDYATAAQGTKADAALPKAGGAMTGAITTNSTFDGRDVATDGSKLDGIEASADVTDETNVTAAGALMDSEVTNLAEVKAFDSTDYATAAQGTKADAALPKAGGAMTGAITTNSTFDGRNVSTDGTKLDTIETNADVTDTANVTAAGALMDSEVDADIKTLSLPANTTISAYGKTIVDDANASAARTTLGVAIGSNVQAYSSVLQNTTASFLTADETKLDYITVTQAVSLDQMEIDIAALENGMVYKGDWDAGSGSFPGGGSAQTGWFYYVSGAGTVNGVSFAVGDNIVATTDNASTSTYASNWSKHDQTDAVQAVVGLTGSITKSGLLSALNVEDGADVTDTANVTAAGALMDSEVDADIKTLVLPASTTISAYGRTLVDDADASAARTTLGLGTAATTAASAYATAAQGTKADAALPKAGGAMTGAITTNSTFDGRDVATDGTKLDNIEANADVTDTANVTAAGALMDSEVDGDIKTLSLPANTTISAYGRTLVDDASASAARTTLGLGTAATTAASAYATAAQGTTANNALPKAGGAMTGAITTNSTFDGRDVATDGAKLDGIAAGATNVTNNNQLTNGAGYTTNVGDITNVSAGVGLSGGGTSGSVTLTLDMSELTDMTATMVGTDEFIVLDASADRRKAANEIGLSIFNNDAGFTTNVGDITGVTAGSGISGGGTSGTVTINHSDTSSQSSVNNSGNTVVQDVTLDTYGHVTGLTSKTLTLSTLGYTGATNANYITNNNQLTNGAGYTTNVGDITGVTAGSGISGGGTSGTVTVSHSDTSSQASLTALTGAAVVSDIDLDTYGHVTNLSTRNITLANLGYTGATNANYITNNNQLTNGAGYTTNTGDITGVTAGTDLTGGGTSGSVTINHADTSTLSGTYGSTSNGTKIDQITVDGRGHVTAITTGATGDIQGVTAGTNLNGGGTSGSVTLNLDSTITLTTVNAGTVNTTSDERAKDDITPITGALDKVQQLGGYSFTLKATDEKSSGVIAQEVQKVMPELVQEGAEGLLSVQYGNMVGLLIEAIKEQQAQIDELKQKLNG